MIGLFASRYEAAPIEQLKQIEDPAIFRDPRGNLHMLTNANSGHARCAAGGACGGHSWSRDGLSWSPVFNGAFGPNTMLINGTVKVRFFGGGRDEFIPRVRFGNLQCCVPAQ